MEYNHILVRFGELTTKGKNRKSFIRQLFNNTKVKLASYSNLTYTLAYDRLYIMLNGEDVNLVVKDLKQVFGIFSFSIAYKVESNMDAIKAGALEVMESKEGGTFKVETNRHDKAFPLTSLEISRQVAGYVLTKTTKPWKVDVHEPSMRLRLEVRQHESYIMTDVIQGAGGYPVGVGGKALLMLSGGIDSPVAGYLTLKRGLTLECIHFASPPYTSDRARQKVLDLAKKLTAYAPEIKVHVIPFTDIQLAIYENTPESYAMTIMRRMMLRIAQRVADEEGALALATGESVGQVASQTLHSMHAINNVTSLPIIRPVVCMDKVEIMDVARKIDTYDLSILPYEDCCTIFTPKNPATKPQLNKCEEYEARWDFEPYINDCVNQRETIVVSCNETNEEDIF